MRELKPITQEPVIVQRRRRQPIYWRIAQHKAIPGTKRDNYLIESYYHDLIAIAKSYLSKLPDDYSRTCIEKNYKQDPHQGVWMYTFFCSCMKIDLHCYPSKQYHVHFDFYYCPFEAELRSAIEQRFRYLLDFCNQWPVVGGCEEYFKRMLFHYDSEDINTLEYDRTS